MTTRSRTVKVTLGTDPEAFVYDVVTAEYIPAYHVLGGDVDMELPYGTAVPDGMAVEFTVTPSDNVDILVGRIGHNLHALSTFVHKTPGRTLTVNPNVPVSRAYIDQLNESYGKRCSLQILGCSPDEPIYPLPKIERPDPKTYMYRTSGGHIHMQVDHLSRWKPGYFFMIALLDQVLGTASTVMSDSAQARARKKLYGWSGYHRTNVELGTVEYRVLTAQALIQDAAICAVMFQSAQAIAQFCVDLFAHEGPAGYTARMADLVGDSDQRNAVALMINNHDVEGCLKHLIKMQKTAPVDISIYAMELQQIFLSQSFHVSLASYKPFMKDTEA
jgi:hypothetical protein